MKRLTVGRSPDNDIVYDDPTVSGHHAYLIIDNGRVSITDHSTNGTWVNGQKLHNNTCDIRIEDNILFPGNNRFDWGLISDNLNKTQFLNPQVNPNTNQEYSKQDPRLTPYTDNNNGPSYKYQITTMSFSEAIASVFKHYADFSGRARRSEYWWFALLSFCINLIPYIGFIWALVVIIPSLAVAIRRLHDIGKSGWYILFGLIPLVGIILLIVWFCQDSVEGNNEYGVNPKMKMVEIGRAHV